MGLSRALAFVIIVFAVLYAINNPTDAINKAKDIYNKFEYVVENKKIPSFTVNVKVSDLPRAQSKYFVLVVGDAGKSTITPEQLKLIVSTLNLPVLIAINPNDVDESYLQSLATIGKLYDISYGIWVPKSVATASYSKIQSYVEKNLDTVSQYIDVNTLVVPLRSIPDDLKKYAVSNSFFVVKAGDGNEVGQLYVDDKPTTDYAFSMLYYDHIADSDVALVKASVQNLIEDHNGVLMVGFDARMVNETETHQDVNLQKGIIDPLLQLENAYPLMNMKFDAFLDFYSGVVSVRLALKSKGSIEVEDTDFGKKVIITIPKLQPLVTLEVPKSVGVISTETLQTVTVTTPEGSIPQNEVVIADSGQNKIIYLLKPYNDVRITLTYVKNSG